MQEQDSSDGFSKITPNRRGGPRAKVNAVFMAATCSVLVPPRCVECTHADWEWDGNGTVRLRLGNEGAFRVGHNSKNTRHIAVTSLYNAIGRELRGRFLPTVDGCDLYIDISESEEAPQ